MQIIKYLTAFGLGAAGSAAWAADKAAQETVEHMPEFWSEVQEHAVNADVPQLLGYPSDPSLTMTYNPDAVSWAISASCRQAPRLRISSSQP